MIEITLAVIIVCIALWIRQRKEHFRYFKRLTIPGPEPNIICGNLLEIIRKNTVEAQRGWIKKYGRVLGYFNGYRPILLVADADLLRQIQIKDFSDFMNRGEIFQSRPASHPENKSLIRATSKEWKEIRSIVTPSFTISKLKMMVPQMSNSVQSLLEVISEKAEKGEEFDIYDHYQALTIEVISRTAFGVHKQFQRNLDDPLLVMLKRSLQFPVSLPVLALACFPGIGVSNPFVRDLTQMLRHKGKNSLKELMKTSEDILKLRRKDPSAKRPDLLQNFVDAQQSTTYIKNIKDEHLTAGEEADKHAEEMDSKASEEHNGLASSKKILDDDTISVNTRLLLAAGYETTSNTLASVTLMLVNHPDVQEKLRKEIRDIVREEGKLDYTTVQKMTYLDCVISETLRLYPPIHSFPTREATADKQYGDIKIPKGLLIQVPVKIIQLDPLYWPDPLQFNPDRFLPENKHNLHPLAFQAFGAGPRNCLGMRFAQMEMKLALAQILQKFRLVTSQRTESDPPKEVDVDLVIIRLKGVYVKAIPV